MMIAILLLLLAPSVVSFAPVPTGERPELLMRSVVDDRGNHDVMDTITSPMTGVQQRRDVFKTGSSLIAALFVLGSGSSSASAEEGKIYSSNARNMARLNNGDSSGGSIYDNNPSNPKTRARRAMVGCKNSSARSLAGEGIGKKQMSEKECNQLIMSGESDFMLGALTELDCPTCPYGIGSR